jgi:uncharacterized damage-inducible protein DinB
MFQMLSEFQQEAATTKRLLERVPGDQLAWKPHSKSMSLGQLAMHIATIPSGMCRMAQLDGFDLSKANPNPREATSTEELLDALDKSIEAASDYIGTLTPEAASGAWRLSANGREIFTIPRAGMLRSLMLNHWYHHRGQLSVYLRLLDVPLPIIYGRSADESPLP